MIVCCPFGRVLYALHRIPIIDIDSQPGLQLTQSTHSTTCVYVYVVYVVYVEEQKKDV